MHSDIRQSWRFPCGVVYGCSTPIPSAYSTCVSRGCPSSGRVPGLVPSPCAPNHSKAEAQPRPARQLLLTRVPGFPCQEETGGSRELSFPQPGRRRCRVAKGRPDGKMCTVCAPSLQVLNAGGIKTCLFGNQWWIAGAKSARSSHGFSLPFFASHKNWIETGGFLAGS